MAVAQVQRKTLAGRKSNVAKHATMAKQKLLVSRDYPPVSLSGVAQVEGKYTRSGKDWSLRSPAPTTTATQIGHDAASTTGPSLVGRANEDAECSPSGTPERMHLLREHLPSPPPTAAPSEHSDASSNPLSRVSSHQDGLAIKQLTQETPEVANGQPPSASTTPATPTHEEMLYQHIFDVQSISNDNTPINPNPAPAASSLVDPLSFHHNFSPTAPVSSNLPTASSSSSLPATAADTNFPNPADPLFDFDFDFDLDPNAPLGLNAFLCPYPAAKNAVDIEVIYQQVYTYLEQNPHRRDEAIHHLQDMFRCYPPELRIPGVTDMEQAGSMQVEGQQQLEIAADPAEGDFVLMAQGDIQALMGFNEDVNGNVVMDGVAEGAEGAGPTDENADYEGKDADEAMTGYYLGYSSET